MDLEQKREAEMLKLKTPKRGLLGIIKSLKKASLSDSNERKKRVKM